MKGRINLTGIKVMASHGVFSEEKASLHPFIADAEIYIDELERGDDLAGTCDYGTAAEMIVRELSAPSVDLIETLASRAARGIAVTFGCDCSVTVHKPEAPLSVQFSDVSVTARARFTRVCLGLGSNMGDRKKYLDEAVERIRADEENKDVRVSSYMPSAPYGGVADGEFLNACLIMRTLKSPHELLDMCANLEGAAGRVRKEHWGNRTLDVDILFYGEEIISNEELTVPHIDMLSREFVLAPLCEIAPGYVHPVYKKTVKDLLAELKGGGQ